MSSPARPWRFDLTSGQGEPSKELARPLGFNPAALIEVSTQDVAVLAAPNVNINIIVRFSRVRSVSGSWPYESSLPARATGDPHGSNAA